MSPDCLCTCCFMFAHVLYTVPIKSTSLAPTGGWLSQMMCCGQLILILTIVYRKRPQNNSHTRYVVYTRSTIKHEEPFRCRSEQRLGLVSSSIPRNYSSAHPVSCQDQDSGLNSRRDTQNRDEIFKPVGAESGAFPSPNLKCLPPIGYHGASTC
ncbi:unnamed protein product, partial [Ectocarpus sp. 8 AP-2014]